MDILFVTDLYGNEYSANVKIAINVATALSEKGVNCHMICGTAQIRQMTPLPGVFLHEVQPCTPASYVDRDPLLRIRFARLQSKRFSFIRKLFTLLVHPVRTARLWRQGAFRKQNAFLPGYALEYGENIRRLCYQQPIDAILALYMPQEILGTISLVDLPKPVYLYQLDPWGLHQLPLPTPAEQRIREETAAFAKAHHIFTTPVLLEAYHELNDYSPFLSKISAVDFPVMTKSAKSCEPFLFPGSNKGDYILLYAGTIADTYRSPSYALQVLRALKGCMPELHVYFMGINQSALLTSFVKENPSWLFLLPPQPATIAQAAIDSANALINIGNTLSNQMPSKIIDCIASGKPLLNFIKSNSCPTLRFTRKYSLALNITENKEIAQAANEVSCFLQKTRDCCLPFEKVSTQFFFATPSYVSEHILTKIREG